jgi:hypothetical protein
VAGSSIEARRARSAALFNNSHVVEVVLQIATLTRGNASEFITTRKIAAATGLADSLVRPVVLRLEDAELLHRLPRTGGPRSEQFFTRATSNQWSKLVQLCRALGSGLEPADGRRPGLTSKAGSGRTAVSRRL